MLRGYRFGEPRLYEFTTHRPSDRVDVAFAIESVSGASTARHEQDHIAQMAEIRDGIPAAKIHSRAIKLMMSISWD